MAEAVELAKLHGETEVALALAAAAEAGRFADGDLAAILRYQRRGADATPVRASDATPVRASDAKTLQRSTAAWEGFGR